nr:ribonuclease H-like domain-containing protein [Tanacetum cinerariifolium]
TLDHGLQLYSSSTTSLFSYSNADWACCPTTKRSTSDYCVFLDNNLLSWSSKHQHTLSRSSAEEKYHGVVNAVAETCWLQNLLRELYTPLPYVRSIHIPSRYQYADIFTKGLPSTLFEEFHTSLSVQCLPAQTDFQDSPNDEDDTSSQEYMDDLEEEYQARDLLAKSKRFFKKGTQRFSDAKATDQTECHKCGRKYHFQKPELRPTKDFEAKYNKVKSNLALFSSSASASKYLMVKNKGLIAEAYEWDDEEVSSDENEMVEVKVLIALVDDNVAINKEGARNGEWVKISMRNVHTLLEMEDNDERKKFVDYLCIDLKYVKEQRNNLLSKHRDLVQELNTCKEQLLVLKQAKLDFLTMQHINTKILKEN